MDIYMKVYKYYNLGTTLSKQQIIDKLKDTDIKNIETYDFEKKTENPVFISYPEPIEFFYELENSEKNITGKVYDYGAMSLNTEIKYEVDSLEEFYNKIKEHDPRTELETKFDDFFEKIYYKFEALDDTMIQQFNHLYTVYCIDNHGNLDAETIIKNNENIIVSILTDEFYKINFSSDQREAVLRYNNSYLKSDYTIVHWNNSLVIDEKENFSEKLFIIELVNIQFIKLQTYDSFIDDYLSEYMLSNNNSRFGFIPFFRTGMGRKIKGIADLRVELERVIDIMDNFEKFQGHWYLARLYYLSSSAFQIPRWRNLVENRVNKVSELYNILSSETNRKRMLLLNVLMLLLFVLWFLGI